MKSEHVTNLSSTLEHEILSMFAKVTSKKNRCFSFYDVYVPSRANRLDAENLIKEAIEILDNDKTLQPEAKKKIIQHLEKALRFLKEGNNSVFFGFIKEIIIVLGAVGSIAGGYVAVAQQVQTKLEKASSIIEQTSVTPQHLLLNSHSEHFDNTWW